MIRSPLFDFMKASRAFALQRNIEARMHSACFIPAKYPLSSFLFSFRSERDVCQYLNTGRMVVQFSKILNEPFEY